MSEDQRGKFLSFMSCLAYERQIQQKFSPLNTEQGTSHGMEGCERNENNGSFQAEGTTKSDITTEHVTLPSAGEKYKIKSNFFSALQEYYSSFLLSIYLYHFRETPLSIIWNGNIMVNFDRIMAFI